MPTSSLQPTPLRRAHLPLAPFQMISPAGVALQTPPGKTPEDNTLYNSNTRIYVLDGQGLITRPAEDFEGLVWYFDFDPNETDLSKALIDFGHHHMRPDLPRLVIDTDRKSAVSKVNASRSHEVQTTVNRVELSNPFSKLEFAEDKLK